MTVTTSVFAGRDGDIHARCVSLDTNSERERERERERYKNLLLLFRSFLLLLLLRGISTMMKTQKMRSTVITILLFLCIAAESNVYDYVSFEGE